MVSETSAKEWLLKYLSDLLKVPPSEIDTSATFDEYGLESGVSMALLAEFEEWMGSELPLSILDHAPSIDYLAAYVRTTHVTY
jgi:acyl carrier protein